VYGPTEATTLVSRYRVEDLAPAAAGVPLGTPLSGSAVYLLDSQLRSVVDHGARGEIYIGGEQVTRGYVNRPVLTSRAFVPDPFSTLPGSRMYRTGDIGIRVEGDIAFGGRSDHQVKIRGFRVELSEVEHALRDDVAVRDACAVLCQVGEVTQQIAAFVVAAGDAALEESGLRRRLASSLPDYMLPSRFYLVPVLPLGLSGKVDRKALTELAAARIHPRGSDYDGVDAGEKLLEIFRRVLDSPGLGQDDDFFAHGGDSLLAIRVVAEAREAGIEISLIDLFTSGTISALSTGTSGTGSNVATSERLLMPPSTRSRSSYPATYLQRGLIFESLLSGGSRYIDVVSLKWMTSLDEEHLLVAIASVIERHPVLRTSFDITAETPVQIVHDDVSASVTFDDWSGVADVAIRALLVNVVEGLSRPFDLDCPPLIRFHVGRCATGFYLSYAFHHAILDGWSEARLALELAQCYSAVVSGVRDRDLELGGPASFAAYVELEQAAAADDASVRYFAQYADLQHITPAAVSSMDSLSASVPAREVGHMRHLVS
jgi:aryl carrier-like protein